MCYAIPAKILEIKGEDAKVDVTGDGYYDIYVKLNGIVDGKADVTVKKINELIPVGGGAVSTTGEDVTGVDVTTEAEGMPVWGWIIVILVVLAAAVGGGVAIKKRK